jgi:hypothetical protein
VVGVLESNYSTGPDNLNRLDCELYFPADRADVARELLLGVADLADEMRRDLVGIAGVRGTPLSTLLEELGIRAGSAEEWNIIQLSDAPTADYRRWAAETPVGYSAVFWSGRTPPEWVADEVRLLDTMNDAPLDDLTREDQVWDAARLAQVADAWDRQDIEGWTTCARHDESGRLAAFTVLELSAHRPRLAGQGDTAVLREHRGHRLGRWIKSVQLVRLLDERPEVRAIETWNAASNTFMVGVNRELGARCEAVWAEWEVSAAALRTALDR